MNGVIPDDKIVDITGIMCAQLMVELLINEMQVNSTKPRA